MISSLLFVLLGASAPTGLGLEPAPVPMWQDPTSTAESYATLKTEYTAAVKTHRTTVRATKDLAERKRLRANHPAKTFRPRFQLLADHGDARGLLWMVAEQRNLGVAKKDREAQKLDLYGQVLTTSVAADWYPSALETVANDRKLTVGQRVNMLKRVPGLPEASVLVKQAAAFHTGMTLMSSKVAEEKDMGKKMLKELIEKSPKSEYAMQAKAIVEKPDLSIGAMAPDFVGTSIDGETFRLSDYRGKVVLVDFFGFW